VGCNALTGLGGATVNHQTIVVGGWIRYYEWTASASADPKPVLLAFHGLGGNAADMRLMSGLAEAGREAGFTVAFPEAAQEANRGWSAGCAGCTTGDVLGIDDVAYVDALLNDLATRTSIDRSRVYAAGFSMGAWFTYTLACHRSDIVRAIVAVGGLMPRPVAELCAPTAPVGVLVIFGDHDPTQPIAGKPGPFGLLGADSSAIFWSNFAHCRVNSADEPRLYGRTEVSIMQRTECDGGVTISRHRAVGLEHVWPSGSYHAPREALRFFAAH